MADTKDITMLRITTNITIRFFYNAYIYITKSNSKKKTDNLHDCVLPRIYALQGVKDSHVDCQTSLDHVTNGPTVAFFNFMVHVTVKARIGQAKGKKVRADNNEEIKDGKTEN